MGLDNIFYELERPALATGGAGTRKLVVSNDCIGGRTNPDPQPEVCGFSGSLDFPSATFTSHTNITAGEGTPPD